MRSASAAGTQIRLDPLGRVVLGLGDLGHLTRQDDVGAVGMGAGVRPCFADQGQNPGAAGLFQQFAGGGGARIGVGRLEAAGRQLDRHAAQAVPVLFDQQHIVVGVQGDDLDPVRIFQHVIGSDHRAFVGDAIVGANADPAILVNIARGGDPPLPVGRHALELLVVMSLDALGVIGLFDRTFRFSHQGGRVGEDQTFGDLHFGHGRSGEGQVPGLAAQGWLDLEQVAGPEVLHALH
jgi:hypothetical protein